MNDSVGWIRCCAFLKEQELPKPRLPPSMAHAIMPMRDGLFATPGWNGGFSLDASVTHWLADAAPSRAWIGVHGHGLLGRTVSLALTTPRWGVFVRKRWRPDLYGEHGDIGRIEGSWQLLHRLQEAADEVWADKRWPHGRRLLLVEDELASTYWGWAEGKPALIDRREGAPAWWEALMAIDQLSEPSALGGQLGPAA